MKILRVIASMKPHKGGPCQGIRYSIPALEKLGVSNEVVCLDDPSEDFLATDPFPIIALGEGIGPWQYNEKLIPWLMQNFSRVDVVIVHGLWLYPSFAVKKALYKFKKSNPTCSPKMFIMPHGMLDPYFQRASGRQLKAIRNWFYWKLIEKNVVNGADGVLFTCEEELKLAHIPFHPYHPIKELAVGYGIAEPPKLIESDLKSIYNLIPKLRNKNFLLFISRIHEKKGIDLLVKAYAEIWKLNLSKGTDTASKLPLLVIAGPGLESEYGEKIKNLAKTSTPENTVFFSGMITGKQKWSAFYNCEAFILPSHQENFGIAVVEALGCGKPVLISDQININREIINCEAGIITKDNLEGVINQLLKWIDLSTKDKILMGKNARNCYLKYFSLEQNAKKLLSAIQGVN